MRHIVVCLAVMFASTSVGLADTSPPEIDDAIAQARLAGKPLLIELSASWCAPCRIFHEKVLPDPAVANALRGWSYVAYDIEVGPGIEAALRYEVDALPSFVAVDGEGIERARLRGAMGPEKFVAFLADAGAQMTDVDTLVKRLAESPADARLLLQMARLKRARGERDEALTLYDRAAKGEGDERASADGAWEAAGIRRIEERRRRVEDDAVAFVRQFPRSPHALPALEMAALIGRIEGADLRAALEAQVEVHADDPAALYRLELLARAVDEPEQALQASQALRDLAATDGRARDMARRARTSADNDVKRLRYRIDHVLDLAEAHRFERLSGFDVPSRRPRDPGVVEAIAKAFRSRRSAVSHGASLYLLATAEVVSGDSVTASRGGGSLSMFLGPATVSLSALGGITDDGADAFAVEALAGVAVRRERTLLGVRSGIAADQLGDSVPSGATIPIDLFVHVEDGFDAWFRVAAALDDARKRQSLAGPLDETAIGANLRVSGPVWLGASAREQMGIWFLGMSVGIGLSR